MEALPIDAAHALDTLATREVVSCLTGSLAYMKEVRDKCLAAGIPAKVAAPSAGGGCGPKAHLLVEAVDVPRVAAVLDGEWRASLAREGVAPPPLTAFADGEHLPCPACGTAAPLEAGACSDCGLQLDDDPSSRSCGPSGCGPTGCG
ncbi:MAG: hypothetical protein R2939_17355 [Kofleriaceae bacterium]